MEFLIGSTKVKEYFWSPQKWGYIWNVLEEVFGSNHAMWFSADGKKLAYVKFNDNTTELMTIPYYGIPGSLDAQYTRAVQIRYPKVWEKQIFCIN